MSKDIICYKSSNEIYNSTRNIISYEISLRYKHTEASFLIFNYRLGKLELYNVSIIVISITTLRLRRDSFSLYKWSYIIGKIKWNWTTCDARLTNLYYKACAHKLVQFALVLRLSYYLGLHLSIIYVDKPAAQHTEIFSKIYLLFDIYINKLYMDIYLHRIIQ